jgi:hypothetical protein
MCRKTYCLLLALFGSVWCAVAEPTLGDAPTAPTDVSKLPGRGAHPNLVNGGFSVDTSSREQVRSFYRAIYPASDNVPMNTSADVASCTAGTNAPAFQDAVVRRINWFRAMAGIPAAVTLLATNNFRDQFGAMLMSANNTLQHTGIPTTWTCFNVDGTNAAANSNLALGYAGADAITGYINDFGANNFEVGHRRWILYPQTQVMGTGDVPAQGSFNPANATWVFDANFGGPRPATRQRFVAWPPAGFVPYPVVFPRWSFALTNANFSSATVTMKSNNVVVPVTLETVLTGFGENTLVWHPTSIDANSSSAVFPFGGTDTVYSVAVSNITVGAQVTNYSYTVTLFDPAVPGADYFPPVISGSAQPGLNAANGYTFTPITNATSYQWRSSLRTNGNLFDGAEGGLVNFTATTSPGYSVITNGVVVAGTYSFHFAHPTAGIPPAQIIQLNELLFPATNGQVTFQSLLGYADVQQIAKVQMSTDAGATWQDIYSQAGTGNSGDATFTTHSLSLSNYAAKPTLLRFDYYFQTNANNSWFSQTFTSPPVGWFFDNIVVTNCEQLVNLATNATASTNFTFTPTQLGNFNLEARALLFTDFPLDWGPVKQVTVVSNAASTIVLNNIAVTNNQVQINFAVSGPAATFKLLQANPVNGSWTTNGSAALTTNVPGSSYRFTTTNAAAIQFYRVQTP